MSSRVGDAQHLTQGFAGPRVGKKVVQSNRIEEKTSTRKTYLQNTARESELW
jgi:hypothetical protein